MKRNLGRIIVGLAVFLGAARLSVGQIAPGKYNNVILDQIRAMPSGGKYSASRAATIRLQSAAHFESGIFSVVPDAASPSYCSGATYLVFIKTIETLRARGSLSLNYATLESLLIRNQRPVVGQRQSSDAAIALHFTYLLVSKLFRQSANTLAELRILRFQGRHVMVDPGAARGAGADDVLG